jgi:hypothetical protein
MRCSGNRAQRRTQQRVTKLRATWFYWSRSAPVVATTAVGPLLPETNGGLRAT